MKSSISLALTALLFAACDTGGAGSAAESTDDFAATLAQVPIPPERANGEALFNANCATCHGQRALGTDRGPPLVHIIYEPSHHADIAFTMAAERGVRAHHWNFGDMAPVASVTRPDMTEIVAYVRFLQQQVGIQ